MEVNTDRRVTEMSTRMISAQLKRSQWCALNLKRFEISSDTDGYGNGDKHVSLILIIGVAC